MMISTPSSASCFDLSPALFSLPSLDAQTRHGGSGTGDSPVFSSLGRLAKACCSWASHPSHPGGQKYCLAEIPRTRIARRANVQNSSSHAAEARRGRGLCIGKLPAAYSACSCGLSVCPSFLSATGCRNTTPCRLAYHAQCRVKTEARCSVNPLPVLSCFLLPGLNRLNPFGVTFLVVWGGGNHRSYWLSCVGMASMSTTDLDLDLEIVVRNAATRWPVIPEEAMANSTTWPVCCSVW